MKLGKLKITNKGLYWGLIITFVILYACVGFVSTLHSITFFQLANTLPLAILLGLTYEVGQASVLFSILMTKNKEKFLPWALMILLTALQVTANVYASFKFMAGTGSMDYQYWQKAILFGVQASTPEMYQVIISWISGALLPVIALGMTALVAENIKMAAEDKEDVPTPETPIDGGEKKVQAFLEHEFKTPAVEVSEPKAEEVLVYEDDKFVNKPVTPTQEEIEEIIENEVQKRMAEIPIESIAKKYADLQKSIDEYKSESEMNPRTEMSEIIDDGGISNEPRADWRVIDGKMHPDHIKFVEEQTKINEALISDPNKTPLDLSQFVSPGVPLKDEMEQSWPSDDEINPDINEEIDNLSAFEPEVVKPVEEPVIEAQFQKDLIVEPPKKQRGRPPKQKDNVVELKKEQEPLPAEEVKVPQKQKRSVDPLKLKGKKIKPVKSLKEINKPSKGDEVIALLEKLDKAKQKDSITQLAENNQESQDSILVPPELKDDYNSFVMNGVEVIDAKAVPIKKN